MNLHQAFKIFMSYFAVERHRIATQKVEKIAFSENLDKLLGVEKDCKPGSVYYSTVHGFRILDSKLYNLNQFVITKKGQGFSKARDLPYIYRKKNTWFPPQLIVCNPSKEALVAGYAAAIRLPCNVAGLGQDYPQGTLVVSLTMENEEVAIGYANALRLPIDRRSVYVEELGMPDNNSLQLNQSQIYIERIDMLDTEYAAMLEDSERF